MKYLLRALLTVFLISLTAQAYAGNPLCWPKQTGQTTEYEHLDDGALERGIPHDYTVLTTGDQSGTTNVSILGNTDAISNEYVWDNRTGLGWQREVTDGLGPGADGKLFWQQWTLTGKTDILFVAKLGSELITNVNDRTFAAASNWTNTDIAAYDEAGDLTITANAADQYCTLPKANAAMTAGNVYKLEFTCDNLVDNWTISDEDANQTISATVTGGGAANTFFFTCSTTGGGIRITSNGNTSSGDFDDFTLKQVTGGEINSAGADFETGAFPEGRIFTVTGDSDNNGTYTVSSTATTTSKITVDETSIEDEAAGDTVNIYTGELRNLCLQSEDFSTTWSTTRSSVGTNATTAPDGTLTADKLVEDGTAGNNHNIYQTIGAANFTDSTDCTCSVYAKQGERTWLCLSLRLKDNSWANGYFDLGNGVVGSKTATSSSIESAPNGFYRCSITHNIASGATDPLFFVALAEADNDQTYDGDGTSGAYLWGAQVEDNAASAGNYVRTTTAVGYEDDLIWQYRLMCCLEEVGGYYDWRVSNRGELESLFKFEGGSGPYIDTTIFPSTPNSEFWCSTTIPNSANNAFDMIFTQGAVFSRKKKQTQRQRKKFRKVVKELDEEYSAIDEAQEKRRERKGLTDRLNNMF